MSDDLAKFLFLGAMILIIMVSNRGAIYKEAGDFSGSRLSAAVAGSVKEGQPAARLFVLEPPQQPVKDEKSGDDGGGGKTPVSREAERAPIVVTPPTQPDQLQAILFENAPIAAKSRGAAQNARPGSRQGGDISAPEVNAASALVADLLDERTFFELFPERRWPIASITKLVSAAVVSKNFPMHETITIAAEDFTASSAENYLKEGERYSARDVMAAMLMKSSNQAAEALARFFGRAEFIQAMNRLAREWGLNETHFDDPTGLSASNQSTAQDLLRLAKNIYERYPEIFRITRQESAAVTELNSGKKVIIRNINLFAGKEYFLGGKTGYTDEAGGNLLSVFNYENKPVLVVVLGTDDRFGETERLFNWAKNNI